MDVITPCIYLDEPYLPWSKSTRFVTIPPVYNVGYKSSRVDDDASSLLLSFIIPLYPSTDPLTLSTGSQVSLKPCLMTVQR